MLKSEWEARQYPSSLSLEEDKASGWVYQFGDTHVESSAMNNSKSKSHTNQPVAKPQKDMNNPTDDPVKKLIKRFMGKGIGATIAVLLVIGSMVEEAEIGELLAKWFSGPEKSITETVTASETDVASDVATDPLNWTGTAPGMKIAISESSYLVTGARFEENQLTYVESDLESKHYALERSDNYVEMSLQDTFPIFEGVKNDDMVFDITDAGDLMLTIANSEKMVEPLKASEVKTSTLSSRFFEPDGAFKTGVCAEAVFVDLNGDNRQELLMLYDNYVDAMVLEVYMNTGNVEKPFACAGFREVGRSLFISKEGYLIDGMANPHLAYEVKAGKLENRALEK